MQHYWGAKAIVERVGLRDTRRLPFLIKRFGLPAFLRRSPGKLRSCYYTSESAITAWELARGMQQRETLLAKDEERAERRREGARGARRVPST